MIFQNLKKFWPLFQQVIRFFLTIFENLKIFIFPEFALCLCRIVSQPFVTSFMEVLQVYN
jgi:hypothetical protein